MLVNTDLTMKANIYSYLYSQGTKYNVKMKLVKYESNMGI